MLDGNDREKLSPIEQAKKEHFKKYGSILYCVRRDVLCFQMDGMWPDGCRREICVLDDPKSIKQKEEIQRNRAKRNKEEQREDAVPIRNQTNKIKSHENRMMDRIRELEEESEQAFRNNDPRQGETLFNRAMILRGELKQYLERKKNQ